MQVERYTALNETLLVVESKLVELRSGGPRAVWVIVNPWSLKIGVDRYNGKWRLMYLERRFALEPDLLTNAPLEIQLQCVPSVRDLMEQIVREKEDWVPKVDEAIETLKELLGAE